MELSEDIKDRGGDVKDGVDKRYREKWKLARDSGGKGGRPKRAAIEEWGESAFGAEPGGLLRNPMPSKPCALLTPLRIVLPFGQVHFVQSRISVGHGRRSIFCEGQKIDEKRPLGRMTRLVITGKEPDQSGTAPSNQKYKPCLPANTESNQFRAGRLTRAALPALSRSNPCAQRLTAGLRKVFGIKGHCVLKLPTLFSGQGLPSSCLPQRPTPEGATREPCRMKP